MSKGVEGSPYYDCRVVGELAGARWPKSRTLSQVGASSQSSSSRWKQKHVAAIGDRGRCQRATRVQLRQLVALGGRNWSLQPTKEEMMEWKGSGCSKDHARALGCWSQWVGASWVLCQRREVAAAVQDQARSNLGFEKLRFHFATLRLIEFAWGLMGTFLRSIEGKLESRRHKLHGKIFGQIWVFLPTRAQPRLACLYRHRGCIEGEKEKGKPWKQEK